MKFPACILTCLVAGVLPAFANPASKSRGVAARINIGEPKYKSESPLPVGWPEPGPFNQVVRKKYPAYRAAFTPDSGQNGSFMRLFRHIKSHDIPMTAPVEMKMEASETQGMKMEEMGFLYQSPAVGKTGADKGQVEVRDVPAREALSYAWQGSRDKAAIARARKALEAALASAKLESTGFRMLGYNSPFIPRSKQTHELQALLK